MTKWLSRIVFLLVAFVGLNYAWMWATTTTSTAQVTDKQRDPVEKRYLIFTTDTTYEISEIWLYGRFNTSDEYGKLAVGQTYEFETTGIRFSPLSWYPNILGFKKK